MTVGRIELRIPLSQSEARALQALGYGAGGVRPLHEVVRSLISAAVDGVRRPGAWERAWLCQAFGDEWTAVLEPDPGVSWHQRPNLRKLRRLG